MADIFISYNREDKGKTKALVDDIQKLRHTVWFDQELSGGQIWWEKILESIRNCDVFVFVLSVKSLNSTACKREYNYASELGKTILPLLIDEEVSINLLPPILSKLQLVNYWRQDSSATIQLVNALAIAPTAQPLPDPLPLSPEVPISYLSSLTQQVDSSSDLSLGEQSTLLLDLKRGLNDPESSKDAWTLLEKLRKRRDLLAIISNEIDKLSGNTPQETMAVVHQEEKLEQKETKKEKRINTINKKMDKSTIDNVYYSADILVGQGRYSKAIVEYDKAIAIDPDNADILNRKGFALYVLGRYDEAIAEYDKAIAIDPDNFDILNNKGLALSSLGRDDEAIAEYDKTDPDNDFALYMEDDEEAIAIDPDNADILNSKGLDLYILEQNDEAIVEYDKAIAIDPDNADILNNKGLALFSLGQNDEAIIEYDKAIAIDPDNADVLHDKGYALFSLERYDEAIVEFDKAIAINPDNAEFLNSKGFALYILGQNDEAIDEYDKAIAIDPDNASTFYNKAYVYASEYNKKKLLQNLKKAIQKNNEYREVAKSDEVLKEYWNDKDFKKLVD